MNIFEFLGLPENHRAQNKVTQLVKHYDEVIEKHKTGKNLAVQVKKDGVCSLTVILPSGNIKIFSRTGKEFTNTEIIKERISELGLPHGIYMGEMWLPKSIASLEQVSGATNPNRVKPLDIKSRHIPGNLEMAFFDNISIKEFIAGSSSNPYHYRHNELLLGYSHCAKKLHDKNNYKPVAVEVLPYLPVDSEEEIDAYLNHCITHGEEGIIIRDLDADWSAGHKGWRVMKKVRGVDYDLKCVGYEEGEGKYTGKVANLMFNWKNGSTIKAMLGKGWTHDMAEEMFKAIGDRYKGPNTKDPIGQIFQVYALEESSKGKLRLVKVGERRHDKGTPDV